MREQGRRQNRIIAIIATIVCIISAVVYLFTPVGTGRYSLSEGQIDSLCSAFAAEPVSFEHDSLGDDLDVTTQAAVKVFGVKDNGEYKTIYGYASVCEYLRHKDKAYDIAGGNWEFMIDAAIDGDNVRIVRQYGDGVSSASTYGEMPFRYRFQIQNYDAFDSDGYCKTGKEADKKAAEVLGVPVETKYTLSIDGEEYQIYDIDTEGNVDIIEKGSINDL